jgi:universal stress protein E
MKRFKNILVGVDFASDERPVGDGFSHSTQTAIDCGLWLAKHNNSKLAFFSALEVPSYAQYLAEEHGDVELSLVEEYEDRLAALVRHAEAKGVAATVTVAFGKSWVEMIREVLKQEHDLVIVGTRQRGSVANVLLGSTGMKLLRKCPCPVWITKPKEQQLDSILVADDLTPVSDLAVELGGSMASLQGAKLHVLHALELGLGRHAWDSFSIRQQARAEATEKLKAQLARLDTTSLREPVSTDVVAGAADAAILEHIEKHNIGLLVMGTVARGGVAGVFTGNTAERLLPRIPCSVLAVKPHDFVCPIPAD